MDTASLALLLAVLALAAVIALAVVLVRARNAALGAWSLASISSPRRRRSARVDTGAGPMSWR